MKRAQLVFGLLLLAVGATALPVTEASEPGTPFADGALQRLDPRVVPDDQARELSSMLAHDVRARVQAANLRESRAWDEVKTRAGWERFRDRRVEALRQSLGETLPPPGPLKVVITGRREGDGHVIENLVFESRPGLAVTANLYAPAKPRPSMPGILISHSHHNPKTQGELQDMGMTWARQGCLVLVMDHLGHGERRQHPFRSAADYARPYRVGRQDYYFRYVSGVQLQLAGESLMGWLAWDLRRGIDLLLARPGIDPDRVILLGAVAGGGDPAGVTAALDPRVKAVVPFNFGGTQPDYATPDDPDRDFYFFGVAHWESTRALRLGARDGFAQWLIVSSVAPRRVIAGHEFAWEPESDPAWPRMTRVFDFYGAAGNLAFANGTGTLRGTPPESSHCNNIGPLHRSKIYPALERWFAMPVPDEFSRRRPAEELECLTPAAVAELRPQPLHTLAADLAGRRATSARAMRIGLGPDQVRHQLREDWTRLLGVVEPLGAPRVVDRREQRLGTVTLHRITLGVDGEPRTIVPVVLLEPEPRVGSRLPVIVALAQGGKQSFLEQRSKEIATWLAGGAAVCLVDVRGTGETRPRDGSRRHSGSITSISATEWLLGQTLLGSRLRDLRSVLRHLRDRSEIDAGRIALWGDSFAPTNPPDFDPAVPLDADPYPQLAEPLGGLLALFGALFEDNIRAVAVRGGLIGYAALLESPYCYVPHDALVPAALTAGDLGDVASALAPRPLRIGPLVDGLNRAVPADTLTTRLEPVRQAYRARGAESHLQLAPDDGSAASAASWLLTQCLAD